jgi:beta-mannosidase
MSRRYQAKAFYDACDELGLMVWQEFAFACALYPRDDPFLQLVGTEVRQQTARIGTHASVVIWGGNNENEAALNWYEPSRTNRDVYTNDEVALCASPFPHPNPNPY